jgi:hypothetical protein
MELVGRHTFEQAVAARLVQWERTRKELEQRMGRTPAACRDQLGYQIEKLEAKYGAAISKLKELDPSLSEDRFRRSE